MITEDYVSYGTSKLLKEKGFDETCRAFWKEWNGEISLCGCNSSHTFEYCHNTMLENYNDSEETNIAAPTLQMAMKWLRELKRCVIVIIPKWFTPYGCAKYAYSIWADDNLEIDGETVKDTEYDTYEKTCEEAIRYCLEKLI